MSSTHTLIPKIQQILRSHELNKWSHPALTMLTQKSVKQLFAFQNLHQHTKNQFIPAIHARDTVNFRVLWPDWPHPFLTMPTQNIFDQLLIYVNLYKFVKNQAISLNCSGDVVDWKILQSDWVRTFWPVSQRKKFSKIWDLCRNTTNSVKLND